MDELEITEEIKAKLRDEQNRLIRIIESFVKLEKSKEWGILKELVFGKSLEAIERQLFSESLAKEIKPEKLYKLQGEWVWAKQFCDTNQFVDNLKKQLEDIKKRLP